MPTVIVLDVSLSMSRPVPMADSSEEYQRRHLAVHGINTLLDFIAANAKLEFTSLVCYSYLWERLVPFTRDFESVKCALTNVELYNKTCIETALAGVGTVVQEEWSNVVPCQVIVVTDGSCGMGQGSLKHSLQTYNQRDSTDSKFPLPFPFPAKLHILCISNPGDSDLKASLPLYQKLIDINDQGGEVYSPDSPLSFKTVEEMFQSFAEKTYTPFHAMLQCGNFKCPVQLHPRPEPYDKELDFQCVHREMSNTLNVAGFLDIAEVASPPTLSRHLILPTSTRERNTKSDSNGGEDTNKDGTKSAGVKTEEEEDGTEDGKTPSFAVLLHGSLKVESMVAITKIGEDWYGMLYSWADSKKKSNLMLSVFEPGLDNTPWLGNLESLCPASMVPLPVLSPTQPSPQPLPHFPVRPGEKRSYAQSCVVWIKDTGLQSDMQKVLRHARKLPDKQQQFYKEMNRIRRAALSFGFHELLEAMATMLERESMLLPGTAHPSASMQLSHAANGLRSPAALDIVHTIMPLQTNFAAGDRA
ncbi:integrator complex subunit 14-like [Littorina saxatilis]|uniref:Integrator complex subunit 14 n=1 Tax=Littorina saxatilis TaxID=31220 RepID=A0AAN9C0V9_9CAEN